MRRKILLVEDNADDVALTVRVIEEHGLDTAIDVAGDGVEALDYLAANADALPDLMLVDLNLPRMNGIELLRRLRAEPATRHIPVVVLTSSNEDQDLVRSYDSGANSYVRKPVNYDEFVMVARTLGEYWLAINRPPPARVRP